VELLGLRTPAEPRRRKHHPRTQGPLPRGRLQGEKIARMYATTDTRVVCVANYSQFKSGQLRRQVHKQMTDGGIEILIAGEF
jgi:hypothetical protein